jgi:adenylosuccinate synthase
MSLDNLNTGDILLFSHVSNWSGPLQIFSNFFDFLIKYWTNSKYNHIGMVVRDPNFTYGEKLRGLYMLESNYEGFMDSENGEVKFGVQLVPLDRALANNYSNVYWRKLECKRDDDFYKRLDRIHMEVHNKPYDTNIIDWLEAATGINIGDERKTNTFWCSALVAYIYEEMGFIKGSIPWSVITPAQFSSCAPNAIEFKDCEVLPEKEIYICDRKIENVDICCGLAWGDEGKGKVVSYLAKVGKYDFVCRWAGGNNAGHTIVKEGKRFKTNLIPSGIFYGVPSIIGPDCVINIEDFYRELDYLKEEGFDISLVKVSPRAHIISSEHITEDRERYQARLGTTARGIAPCYRDKYARIGKRVRDCAELFSGHIWDEKLWGNILCEGAQGYWLDINTGNYPYITSSNTLPFSACSLGIAPQYIRHIYGAAKIYDTRVGVDTDFPAELDEDPELVEIGRVGNEFGVTTGRKRRVNWLNMDKLIRAINTSGTTHVIISKVDIFEKIGKYRYLQGNKLVSFLSLEDMTTDIYNEIKRECPIVREIMFSNNRETIGMIETRV